MEKVFEFVFKKSWSVLILMQVLFFGGLFIAETPEKEYGLAKLLICLVWFGSGALWMYGKQKKLFKN